MALSKTRTFFDGLRECLTFLSHERGAPQVAADGSWLSGPTPDLSSAGSGRYILVVRNPDGVVAGSGLVDVYEEYSPPRACNPSEGQVDNCISMIGCYWDVDSCSCKCRNA